MKNNYNLPEAEAPESLVKGWKPLLNFLIKSCMAILPAVCLTLIGLAACSSRPARETSPVVAEAHNLYRTGKAFARQGKPEHALRSYHFALDRYTSVDYLEGIILTEIGIVALKANNPASVFTKTGSSAGLAYQDRLATLQMLVESSAPQFKPHLLLLETELSFTAGDYLQVIHLTGDIAAGDLVVESQLLGYRLMSLLQEDHPAADEYRNLKRNAQRLQRTYRRRQMDEIGLYGWTNYVLGYYHTHKGNWHKAKDYFNTSLEIDKYTDDVKGIAKNLYYLALAYKNLEDIPQAVVHYKRAAGVFGQLNDNEMVNKISDNINSLLNISK